RLPATPPTPARPALRAPVPTRKRTRAIIPVAHQKTVGPRRMSTQKRCTATRAAAHEGALASRVAKVASRASALLVLLLGGRGATAEPVGTVTVSTGPLLARAGDQTLKVLVAGSTVEAGETFFTRADTYSQIRLGDNSSMALGPDSVLAIERYSTDSTTVRL